MKDFFEAIQSLFEVIMLDSLDQVRALELESWAAANAFNWVFMIIGFVAFIYWMKQLKQFEDNNEENKDPKAHSFLG